VHLGGFGVKPCLLIPIYQHCDTIRAVVERLAKHELPCLIIDDGSNEATRIELERLAQRLPWVHLHHFPENRGKGATLKTGFLLARQRGFSHVIHLDADAQHDPDDVPLFVAEMNAAPDALVLGDPRFDDSVPRVRLWARQISRGLTWLVTLSFEIRDPLCGYRGVPLQPVLALLERISMGTRMDFEPELAVRLAWEGVPVRNVPTRVVYHADGLSHFSFVREYPRLVWLYLRLLAGMLPRVPELLLRRRSTP
jgi:glycosyltransferase involved in cell wall biosynthesis